MEKESEIEWSDEEFKAAVAAYFEMLALESKQEKYNKSAYSLRLREGVLHSRTKSSIDFRMQNISAIMDQLGMPRIKGYAPAKNIGPRGTEKIKRAISEVLLLNSDSTSPRADVAQLRKMKVKDLLNPVVAAKSDWSPASNWLGFTPTGTGLNAYAQCQSTINRQINNGYIIEYITKTIQEPNEGHEKDPLYLEALKNHPKLAGRFIAIHKPYFSSRPLEEIIGSDAFEHMQDVWAQSNSRNRWSVAFPIIETYKIIGSPLIKDILSEESYKAIIQRPSATLRELSDEDRIAISELEIEKIETQSGWIVIEDEIMKAEGSEIDPSVVNLINEDLYLMALEGETEERKNKIKKRAAWLAQRFTQRRSKENTLLCDHCGYDPKKILDCENKYYRSLLDVHHKDPIGEGVRYTTESDFELLCPNCHRLEHVHLRIKQAN